MSEPRVFVVTLPRGLELVTMNSRLHYLTKARIVKGIRHAAGWAAKAQKVPRLERARIDAVYFPPTNRIRDRSNLHPAVKAATDGIVTDAGVLKDDSDEFVDGPHVTIGALDVEAAALKMRWGTLVLTLTELPALDAAPVMSRSVLRSLDAVREADHG